MRARSNDLCGIVNGIDYDEFNPETDKYIVNNYNQLTFRKEKYKNKIALQQQLGLEVDPKRFMIGLNDAPFLAGHSTRMSGIPKSASRILFISHMLSYLVTSAFTAMEFLPILFISFTTRSAIPALEL